MTAGRGPLNYSTKIAPLTSASECMSLLVKHGARALGMTYNGQGVPDGLTFRIDTLHGERQYALPLNFAGTHKALNRAYQAGLLHHSDGRNPRMFTTFEHAQRVAWRVLKDWLAAQLALIEAGVAGLDQVMLPYMQIDRGTTVYDLFVEHQEQLALPRGES